MAALGPLRYIFLANGVDRYIEATVRGGFDGWLRELAAYDPDLVIMGRNRANRLPDLEAWLAAHCRRERGKPWSLWVKSDLAL